VRHSGLSRRAQALKLLADVEAEPGQRIGPERVTALRDALEQDWGEA